MTRGATSGFVLLGLMAVGERAMTKWQLKKQMDITLKMQEFQLQSELRELKNARPGTSG